MTRPGCDLHTHTRFSDGTDEPAELVARAAKAGLSCVAVTDHDSVEGVSQAVEEGARRGIEVIPGIELTAELDGVEVHMLGYLLDHRDPGLKARLAELRDNRVGRVHEMIRKLALQGIDLKPEAVFSLSKDGTVGRLHMARAMVNEGIVGSVWEAFDKFIGDRCPAYVSHFRLTPEDAVALLRSHGGVPVLAHPYSLKKDEIIPALAEAGLMGLEVYYPEHSQSMINFYRDLAKKLGLVMTGGSDYHGSAKPSVRLGEAGVGKDGVEALKEAQRRA